jgi:hypothetical protein
MSFGTNTNQSKASTNWLCCYHACWTVRIFIRQELDLFYLTNKQEFSHNEINLSRYGCGEHEFGGLPWWLLRDLDSVQLRQMNPGCAIYSFIE